MRFICVLLLIVIVFHLGGTWSVHNIRADLNKTGTAIAQYGDNGYIKITGTVEEVGD